jgi:hypothetical protein
MFGLGFLRRNDRINDFKFEDPASIGIGAI